MDLLEVLDPEPVEISVAGGKLTIFPPGVVTWFRAERLLKASMDAARENRVGESLSRMMGFAGLVLGADVSGMDWQEFLRVLPDVVSASQPSYLPPELMVAESKGDGDPGALFLELEVVLTRQLSMADFRGLTLSHALLLYKRIREEEMIDRLTQWYAGEMGYVKSEKKVGKGVMVEYKPRDFPFALPWARRQLPAMPAEPPPGVFVKVPGKIRDISRRKPS